ncbi:amino acid adenylation domain-containing protein [Psychrosphaera ytuae]|uniref:Amino acid adenylation domain-containing protein n=1 Tax=Psychrosphaera ytuae TaxID=2820710 RepID=A0A975DDQ2_9GAMM|nr:non-ribosomal peptide synthetase [Psychrosphaera ytuae]QTH65074.1 amino acid adenylation domain-containing protein [Psychrosphaera ytuae]
MQRLPYSLPQKEIWAEWLAWGDSTHLNIGGFSKLQGQLSEEIMRAALQLLVAENDALRLVPSIKGDQILLPSFEAELNVVDFSLESDPHSRAKEWQESWMQQPFINKNAPPIRYGLLKVSDTFHYLVIQSSHMIMDGWSLSIAPQKWAECYRRICDGNNNCVPSSINYERFIEDSISYKASKTFKRDETFWKNKFPELGEALFMERYPSKGSQDHTLSSAFINYHHVHDEIRDAIMVRAKQWEATPFHVYMASLAVYLFESLSVEEVTIGIPALNRSGNKYKQTLGMFVGVLPITIKRPISGSFKDLVTQVKAELVTSYRYAKMPLSEQFKRLKAVNKGRDRLFDVIFSFEVFEFSSLFGDASLSDTKQTFSHYSRYPMAISLCDFVDAKDTEMVIECSERFFSEQEADLIGARLVYLLKQFCLEEAELSKVNLCTPSESQQLSQVPQVLKQQERFVSFVDFVLSHAKVTPKSTALITREQQLTYQEMINAAVNLASLLEKMGAKQGDHLVLALHRGPEVVVSILATAFIGATFIPVDLDWPVSRVDNIVTQAAPKLVLVNEENVLRYSDIQPEMVVVDLPALMATKAELSRLDTYRTYKNVPAYVLFTSGSTGEPKGVSVGHQALLSRLNWIAEAWGLTASDRSLQATQVNFDPSLVELLAPLYAGGSVAFPPPGRLLPEWLPSFIVEFGATLMAFVPSTLRRFIDGLEPNQILPLRVCCCGGEILSYEIAQKFIKATNTNLYNVYGPTEATIFCTAWQVHPSRMESTSMPVGRPLFGTKIYIINAQKNLQPYGVVGEVLIAGAGLADGYLAKEAETRARFIELTLPSGKQVNAYRTGDNGWLDCDGVLHFVGRIDRQVKLRGYRIELTEIENALMSLDGVELAAVKISSNTAKPYLSAWYESEAELSEATIRAELMARLPDYMVPERLLRVSALPVTHSAKVDYQALPEIVVNQGVNESREPIGPLENKIFEIWSKHIEAKELNVNSHFFEAGGDSLSAVICLNELEQYVGQRLSLHQLVSHPTIAGLAQVINSQLNLPELLVSLGDTTRQKSLYIAASGNGDLIRFQALAQCLRGSADIHMLQPPGNVDDISIEELASLYADKIIERGEKQVYLAGFSVGGLVALELAQSLQAKGIDVGHLFIVDTILMKLPRPITWCWKRLSRLVSNWHVPAQRVAGSRFLSAIQDHGLLMQVKAMRNYELNSYSGDAVLIKSSAYKLIHGWLLGGWRKVLQGQKREIQIETSHSAFFQPGRVEQLADVIKETIR